MTSLTGCSNNKVARIEEVGGGDASNPTRIPTLLVVVWIHCRADRDREIMFESASTSIAERESTMINCGDSVFSSSSRCWI
jgi:hypothetical protein